MASRMDNLEFEPQDTTDVKHSLGENKETEEKFTSWNKAWNKYKEVKETRKSKPLCKPCERFLKAPFALFLFVAVLGFGTLSRVTFHIMVWHLQPPKVNDTQWDSSMGGLLQYNGKPCRDGNCIRSVDEEWVWAIFLILIFPYCICILSSLRRKCKENITTNNWDYKDKILIFVVVVFEIADTVGVCLMVFHVLPSLDPATASVLYMFIGFIPAGLDIVNSSIIWCRPVDTVVENMSSSETADYLLKFRGHFIISIIGIAFRITGFTFIMLYINSINTRILFSVACLMVAGRYWENYCGGVKSLREKRKFVFNNRAFLVLLSNILKLFTAVVSVLLIFPIKFKNIGDGITALFGIGISNLTGTLSDIQFGDDNTCSNYIPFILFLINIFSTLCFYKAAKTACVIECQIFSFSFPIIACLPVIILITLLQLMIDPDALNFRSCDLFFSDWSISSFSAIGSVWWKMSVCLPFAVLSYLCLCRHLVLTNGTKQAKTERLFVLPFYCGIFTDISLILNRRRDELEYEKTSSEYIVGASKNETESKVRPKIYACATMWHETQMEMTQLLTSIFRMDKHQMVCKTDLSEVVSAESLARHEGSRADFNISTSTLHLGNGAYAENHEDNCKSTVDYPDVAVKVYNSPDDDTKPHTGHEYEFEAHIFFDDAFEKPSNKTDETELPVVNEYVTTLIRIIQTAMSAVHGLKFKVNNKTYQTPYGGRIEWTLPGQTRLIAHLKDKTKIRARKRWSQVMYMYYLLGFLEKFDETKKTKNNPEKSQNSTEADSTEKSEKAKKAEKAENTYILALDGDVDFQPEAVIHLLNRMKKDRKVGAACGRIHPIGSGAMVWYQKFEYAISHWLQKAAEHVTGCVLCSPGCFSLFRASSLLDTNVIRTYTTEPSEPVHYIQYDQGEDRWLCTLLLKQGYRIDYCAESDALTYAPEGFFDFYKQRRRWSPSTMANIIDILMDSNILVQKNSDISRLYILYQMFLFISSILTPGTIFLLIVGAILVGFQDVPPMLALLLNLIPVGLFMLACIFAKEETQLMFAAIMSAIYAIVMLVVMMGLLKTAVDEGFCSTTTVILCFVVGVFLISAILHPEEASCILHGLLFFIAIPSMSMLMFLYSIGNLNNVNWGTREKKSDEDGKDESYLKNIFTFFRKCCKSNKEKTTPDSQNLENPSEHSLGESQSSASTKAENPKRIDPLLRGYDLKFNTNIEKSESQFWRGLIDTYLFPTQIDKNHADQLKKDLLELRNKVCIIVFLINAILVTLIYALSEAEAFNESLVVRFSCGERKVSIEPLSILFTFTFGILLLIQFVCMVYHRFSTIIHITAESPLGGSNNKPQEAVELLLDPKTVAGITNENNNTSSKTLDETPRDITRQNTESQVLDLTKVLQRNVSLYKRAQENPGLGERQNATVDYIFKQMKNTRQPSNVEQRPGISRSVTFFR